MTRLQSNRFRYLNIQGSGAPLRPAAQSGTDPQTGKRGCSREGLAPHLASRASRYNWLMVARQVGVPGGFGFARVFGAIPTGDLAQDVAHDLLRPVGVQLIAHAPQRYADDIAVVQLGAGTARGQFQPQPVHQVDVLRPQAHRVP